MSEPTESPATPWPAAVPTEPDGLHCPSCGSSSPRLHPAISGGGEVTRICPDRFHEPAEPKVTLGILRSQVNAAIEACCEAEDSSSIPGAVMAVVSPAVMRLAELENTLEWHTTCTSCARMLDSSIRETSRREQAEDLVESARHLIATVAGQEPSDWPQHHSGWYTLAEAWEADYQAFAADAPAGKAEPAAEPEPETVLDALTRIREWAMAEPTGLILRRDLTGIIDRCLALTPERAAELAGYRERIGKVLAILRESSEYAISDALAGHLTRTLSDPPVSGSGEA